MFVSAAQNRVNNFSQLRLYAVYDKLYTGHKNCESRFKLLDFISRASTWHIGTGLHRTAWVKFYGQRTGIKRFHSFMGKWALATIELQVGTTGKPQATSHKRAVYAYIGHQRNLTVLDDETRFAKHLRFQHLTREIKKI